MNGARRLYVSTSAGGFATSLPTTTVCLGDLDSDGEVDLEDYELFAECMAGPDVAPHPECESAQSDFDLDGDVDLADFAEFQRNFGADCE